MLSDLNEFADVLQKKFVSFFGVLFRESPQGNHRTTIMICHYRYPSRSNNNSSCIYNYKWWKLFRIFWRSNKEMIKSNVRSDVGEIIG